jgi:hypothetical protein
MKTVLYIYDLETDEHVATITGASIELCLAVADDRFSQNDYYATCSPAFGSAEACDYNPYAEQIDADSEV